MRAKIVVDKHLDGRALGEVLGRFPMSAATQKPTTKYRGTHIEDEDYTHILQLAWENECPLLTRDGAMIEKAREFRLQFPKIGEERCLRGVVILPLLKDDQVAVLRQLSAGDIEFIHNTSDVKSIDDVEDYNVGVDLRRARAPVTRLCDCEARSRKERV